MRTDRAKRFGFKKTGPKPRGGSYRRHTSKVGDGMDTFEAGLKAAAALTPQQEAAVAAERAKTVCSQCYQPMNPVQRALGPVCGVCCRKNQKGASHAL